MQRTMLVIAIACAACGGEKKTEPAPAVPKTYKLSIRADKEEPPGGVSATITWPAGWTEKEVKPTGPRINIAGADSIVEGAALILRPCAETEGGACFDKWIKMLHSNATEEPVGDRRWVRATLGKLVVGGLFIYHPATKMVVECQAIVKPENEAKIADVRKACEGLSLP